MHACEFVGSEDAASRPLLFLKNREGISEFLTWTRHGILGYLQVYSAVRAQVYYVVSIQVNAVALLQVNSVVRPRAEGGRLF